MLVHDDLLGTSSGPKAPRDTQSSSLVQPLARRMMSYGLLARRGDTSAQGPGLAPGF